MNTDIEWGERLVKRMIFFDLRTGPIVALRLRNLFALGTTGS